MTKKSKKDQVLQHLQKGWTLTAVEAFQLFRVTNLASLVGKLRHRHHIETESLSGTSGSHYARYRYGGEKGGAQ